MTLPTSDLMRFTTNGEADALSVEQKNNRTLRPRGVSAAHFLKLIEERGRVGFWTVDLASGQMTTSIGLYRLFGIHPTIPLVLEDILKVLHPEDRSIYFDMYEMLSSGYSTEREFRIVRPDGSLLWLENKAEVIADGEGRPARIVGVMMDISEQHAARRSGEKLWYHFDTLVKSIVLMELRMKPTGEVLSWDGWNELTGQSDAEASGCGWLDVIHPEDREMAKSLVVASLGAEDIYALDPRILCADGRYRRFPIRAAPILEADGTIREWVGALFRTAATEIVDNKVKKSPVKGVSAAQIRAARALLNWTIDELALKSGVSISSISRLEKVANYAVREHVLQAVCQALADEGIVFEHASDGTMTIHFKPPR
ncbi:PAS domain-containing protein [Oryzifoliimicrobium ureilyticus]|uniref:PAS domain-containing protein n=1 Tax=Oryzifoliimicrobium ureilyticus TaxID=3113724 RepID=UPI0030765349